MTDCNKCFRYRGKERENDALRHELGLMEKENAALRNTLAEMISDGCVLTARADPQPFAASGYYPGAGGGGAAWGMQNTMAQQQAIAQQKMIMAQHQHALGQQMQQPIAGVNAGVMGYTMGCGGAGGSGGNGGNGNSVSARAWCEKHQRWADECGVRSVGDASKSVIAAIKRAMGMVDVTA